MMRAGGFYNSSFGKIHLRQNVKVETVEETAAYPSKGKVVSYGKVKGCKTPSRI